MNSAIIWDGLFKVYENGQIFRCKNGEWVESAYSPTSRNGRYRSVTACIGKKQKHFLVHRMVAEAFLPNPNNYPQINHKDGNPNNNEVSNLEWCTAQQNIQHAYATGLIKRRCNIAPCNISYSGNYLKPSEFCQMLGVKRCYMKKLIRWGILPVHMLSSTTVRISSEDFIQFKYNLKKFLYRQEHPYRADDEIPV